MEGLKVADSNLVVYIHPSKARNIADSLYQEEVVKLSEQSIHIIVTGVSSAVIMDEDIHYEFKYKAKHGEEVLSNACKKHKIRVGTIVRFLVISNIKKGIANKETEEILENNKDANDRETFSLNTYDSNKKSMRRKTGNT